MDRREGVGRDRRCGEVGQVLPLMAALLVVAGALALGAVHLAVAASERARAQTGADAAALAAVAAERPAAEAAASANGAQLETMRVVGDEVVVRVRFRRATARARARLVPDAEAGPVGRSAGQLAAEGLP